MSPRPDANRFANRIKDVTREYGHAWQRYEQAMARGDVDKADEALSRMVEIERSVTLIVHPEARI